MSPRAVVRRACALLGHLPPRPRRAVALAVAMLLLPVALTWAVWDTYRPAARRIPTATVRGCRSLVRAAVVIVRNNARVVWRFSGDMAEDWHRAAHPSIPAVPDPSTIPRRF